MRFQEELRQQNESDGSLLHCLAFRDGIKTLKWLYAEERAVFMELIQQKDSAGRNLLLSSLQNQESSYAAFEWLLTEFPTLADSWIAEMDNSGICFVEALRRQRAEVRAIKLVMKHRRSYFDTHLDKIIEDAVGWRSSSQREFIAAFPSDLEEKKFEFQFRLALPDIKGCTSHFIFSPAALRRLQRDPLFYLRSFIQHPFFSRKHCTLLEEATFFETLRFGIRFSPLHLALKFDDAEVFSLLKQHHKELFLELFGPHKDGKWDEILPLVVKNNANECLKWLCIHMRHQVRKYIDTLLHLNVWAGKESATPLEMILGEKGYLRDHFMIGLLKKHLNVPSKLSLEMAFRTSKPDLLAKYHSKEIWEWVLEQLPGVDVNHLVLNLVNNENRINEADPALVTFLAPLIAEEPLNLLIDLSIKLLKEKGKLEEALQVACLTTSAQKRFTNCLQIDLLAIPIWISKSKTMGGFS